MKIVIAAGSQTSPVDLDSMHRLRYDIFKSRLGWDVPVSNEQEIDSYDAINPIYMRVHEEDNSVCGCWRLLPTTGAYMLKDTFPELLHGQDAPRALDVWELSRFTLKRHQTTSGKFSEMPVRMMQEIVRFADARQIKRYVTVTTVAIERMLRGLGIDIQRFGPPLQIGIEKTVAFSIEVNDQTRAAVFAVAHATAASAALH